MSRKVHHSYLHFDLSHVFLHALPIGEETPWMVADARRVEVFDKEAGFAAGSVTSCL
jgi:hypothetical protein